MSARATSRSTFFGKTERETRRPDLRCGNTIYAASSTSGFTAPEGLVANPTQAKPEDLAMCSGKLDTGAEHADPFHHTRSVYTHGIHRHAESASFESGNSSSSPSNLRSIRSLRQKKSRRHHERSVQAPPLSAQRKHGNCCALGCTRLVEPAADLAPSPHRRHARRPRPLTRNDDDSVWLFSAPPECPTYCTRRCVRSMAQDNG